MKKSRRLQRSSSGLTRVIVGFNDALYLGDKNDRAA